MKYAARYRDPKECGALAQRIHRAAGRRRIRIMEVCGTHTAAIHHFGIRGMIPKTIRLISGPGCPVCVTGDGYLRNTLKLASDPRIIIATYHDMLRVPVDKMSLEKARAQGADVRGVVSALDALALARRNPGREVVFLGVGFETTAPATAVAILIAKKEGLKNFSVYGAHKTIPGALELLARDKTLALDGFLLPGHVSVIIGKVGYAAGSFRLKKPSVICGFEALDILYAILRIVVAVREGAVLFENAYSRIVHDEGNPRARRVLNRVFKPADGVWRGLGIIKGSALDIRPAYRCFDAQARFCLKDERRIAAKRPSGCRCADVLKGKIEPKQCRLFRKRCTPAEPFGACMVSREGTCRSAYEHTA